MKFKKYPIPYNSPPQTVLSSQSATQCNSPAFTLISPETIHSFSVRQQLIFQPPIINPSKSIASISYIYPFIFIQDGEKLTVRHGNDKQYSFEAGSAFDAIATTILIIGKSDKHLLLVDQHSMKRVQIQQCQVYSLDQQYIVGMGRDRKIKCVYRIQHQNVVRREQNNLQEIIHRKLICHGECLLLCKQKQQVFLYNLQNGQKYTLTQCSQQKITFLKMYNNLIFILSQQKLHLYFLPSGIFLITYPLNQLIQPHFTDLISSFSLNSLFLYSRLQNSLFELSLSDIIQHTKLHFCTTLSQVLDLNKDNTFMKTMDHRILFMNTVQNYIVEGKNKGNLSGCIRMLQNEGNPALLSDGLKLLLNHLQTDAQPAFEKTLIQLCGKLIQSKYEGCIESGLLLLHSIYNLFSSKTNLPMYVNIVESKRIQKILGSKKKRLFEAAYPISLKIKNIDFIQGLQNVRQSKF